MSNPCDVEDAAAVFFSGVMSRYMLLTKLRKRLNDTAGLDERNI